MVDDRFIERAGRFLDGEATAAEGVELAEELRHDAEARRVMAQLMFQHATLRWLHSSRATVASVRRPVLRRFWGPAFAAAAVALVIAAGLWLHRSPEVKEKIATLERFEGAVWVVSEGVRSAAKKGQPLYANQGFVTSGSDSWAGVAFPDRTWVELGPDTTVERFGDGQVVSISKGSVYSEVAPRPKDRPMVFRSPHAEVKVLGTILSVTAALDRTRVQVEKGSVQVKRSDGASILLPAGHVATVAKGVALTAVPVPYESLHNGGFETGDLAGWGDRETAIKPDVAEVGRAQAASGNFGLRLVGRSGGIDQPLLTRVGKTYYVSARVRLEKEISKLTWGGVRIAAYPEVRGKERWKPLATAPFVTFVDTYGTTRDYAPAPPGIWVRARFSFVAAAAVTTLRCDLFADGVLEAWLDDVILSPSPIPD